jgi:hypothetical protein
MEERGLPQTADEDLGESMSVLLQLERLHVDTTQGAKPLQVFHGRPTRLTEPPDLAIELSATAVGQLPRLLPRLALRRSLDCDRPGWDYLCTSPSRLASCRSF